MSNEQIWEKKQNQVLHGGFIEVKPGGGLNSTPSPLVELSHTGSHQVTKEIGEEGLAVLSASLSSSQEHNSNHIYISCQLF